MVVDEIVDWNQVAFIKGRSIHHAIFLCSKMIYYAS